YSPFYADVYLAVNWEKDGSEIKNNFNEKGGVRSNVWMLRDTAANCFLRPGLTWPRRTQRFGVRIMPEGAIFADKGPVAFDAENDPAHLMSLLTLMLSRPFGVLIELSLNAGDSTARSYEVGVIQKTPVPNLSPAHQAQLAALARRAWSLKRCLDSVNETSHAFALPAALAPLHRAEIETELAKIQADIDAITFDLYGFSEADRQAALASSPSS